MRHGKNNPIHKCSLSMIIYFSRHGYFPFLLWRTIVSQKDDRNHPEGTCTFRFCLHGRMVGLGEELLFNLPLSTKPTEHTLARSQGAKPCLKYPPNIALLEEGRRKGKLMKDCTGKEISMEWLYHIGAPEAQIESERVSGSVPNFV